jgi:hypothetical protein
MKGLWVVISLLATVTVSGRDDKKVSKRVLNNPVLVKLRTSYKHIHEGVKADIPYYKRLRKLMEGKLSKAKTTRTRKAAKDVIKIFDELIAADKQILGLFDGTSGQRDILDAMQQIPTLEQRLRSVVTMKRKRSWLTFDEYQLYLKRGWRPKSREEKGVLPFSRDLWRPPKKEQ